MGGPSKSKPPGRPHEAFGNERPRWMVTAGEQKRKRMLPVQDPAYRSTRISGPPPERVGGPPFSPKAFLRDDERMKKLSSGRRFLAYGLAGWCAEVLFTGIHDYMRNGDKRLPARTSLWMFPIYGLSMPLFESLHRHLKRTGATPVARAANYGLGFLAVEYASGYALRAALGEAPWDYSDASSNVSGLIRLDRFPVWGIAGLALEPLHDALDPPASQP